MAYPVPIYFVDAFTTHGNSPFTGNAAAVCFLECDDDISDDTKQKIANEANLSDTAFVSLRWTKPTSDEEEEPEPSNNISAFASGRNAIIIRRTLRWLTPTSEVPLCGHATVASTKALVATLLDKEPELKEEKDEILIEFESRFRGLLGATFDCKSERITLNFPSSPCMPLYAEGEKWIEQMIEATLHPELTADSIQDIQYSPSAKIALLRLGDHLNENDLRRVNPDFLRLKSVENCDDMFGVLVTVKGRNPDVENEQPHFYSRFFAPWYGVNEDPVCGAAHTVLTPYWTKEYFNGFGETLLARQHSTRGGNLYCTLVDSERVTLGGEARIIIKGELVVQSPPAEEQHL